MGSDSNSKAKLESQEKSDRRMIIVFILITYTLMGCFIYWVTNATLPAPNLPTMADRLAFALKWQALSVLALLAGILWVSTTRLFTPAINPLDERGNKYVEMPLRYLNNTTEQFLIHFVASLTLSTYLPLEKMMILPMLSVLFVVARLLFAVGYLIRPAHRTTGYAMTVGPTFIALVYCNYCLYKEHFMA